jgi:hypothetical protein
MMCKIPRATGASLGALGAFSPRGRALYLPEAAARRAVYTYSDPLPIILAVSAAAGKTSNFGGLSPAARDGFGATASFQCGA